MKQRSYENLKDFLKPISKLMELEIPDGSEINSRGYIEKNKIGAQIYYKSDNFILRVAADSDFIGKGSSYVKLKDNCLGLRLSITGMREGGSLKIKDRLIGVAFISNGTGMYTGITGYQIVSSNSSIAIYLILEFRNVLNLRWYNKLQDILQYLYKVKPSYTVSTSTYNYDTLGYKRDFIYDVLLGRFTSYSTKNRRAIVNLDTAPDTINIVKAKFISYITKNYDQGPVKVLNYVTGSVVIPPNVYNFKKELITGVDIFRRAGNQIREDEFYYEVFTIRQLNKITKLKFSGFVPTIPRENYEVNGVHYSQYKIQTVNYITQPNSVSILYFTEIKKGYKVPGRFVKIAVGPGINIQTIVESMGNNFQLSSVLTIKSGLDVKNIAITQNLIVPANKIIVAYLKSGEIYKFYPGTNAGELLKDLENPQKKMTRMPGYTWDKGKPGSPYYVTGEQARPGLGFDNKVLWGDGSYGPSQQIDRAIVSAVLIDLSKKEGVKNVF